MPVVKENYDVCIVGAGHAGCEAALACARMGLETIIFTVSVDSIALMPCNPNIGGSSKGHLVREVDFNDEVLITNLRQKQALADAAGSLKMVMESIESGMPEDFFTIDMMNAYEVLGTIIGESVGEDLVNEIFSKFCMGK